MAERRFVPKLVFMLGGLIVWAAHFTAVYGLNALACARDFVGWRVLGIGVVPLGVIAATVLALAAAGWILAQALRWRGPWGGESRGDASNEFLRYATASLAGLSLIAILWDGLPALIVPPCG